MEDDNDGDRRQLVVVVLVLETLRVSVVGDVTFQRYLLAQGHVTVTTATRSITRRCVSFEYFVKLILHSYSVSHTVCEAVISVCDSHGQML